MISLNDDDYDYKLYIVTADTAHEHYKGRVGIITIDRAKNTFNYFIHLASNFICMPLKRYFKSRFSKYEIPKTRCLLFHKWVLLLHQFYMGALAWPIFLLKEVLTWYWLCYGSTPLVWIDTSTCMFKYSLGGYSDYYVAFGTIPNILKFMQYKLW